MRCRARFIGSFISSVFTRYSFGPSRTITPPPPRPSRHHVHVRTRSFVRFALAYVIARAISSRDIRMHFIPPARSLARSLSNGRRFPVAHHPLGTGFPFDFGISRTAKFHGLGKFFSRTSPDTGHINLNGLKSIGVTGTRRPGSRH